MSGVLHLIATVLPLAGGGVWALWRGSADRSAPNPAVSQDFLRVLYHELRSPATSMAALARACGHLDSLDGAARTEALDLLQRHAEHLTAILDDVRELADCMSAGDGSGSGSARSTCSLPEVVRTSAACAGLTADRLRLDVEEGAAFVHTSASALGRILVNLLQNAVRHGPPGAAVVVRARRQRGLAATEVCVLDSGRGPDPADDGPEGTEQSPRERVAEALGLGSRLVDELTASLGGLVRRNRTPDGYAVAVRLPDVPLGRAGVGPHRPPSGP